MNNKRKAATMGVLGAVTGLAMTPAAALAASSEPAVPTAQSFAELLDPIPNAQARLQRADIEAAQRPAQVIEAQYVAHHHHHHHHNQYRRSRAWYRSHGYMWSGGGWIVRPRAHHHHHHHHHNHY